MEFSKFLRLKKIYEYSINRSISKDLVYFQSCDFCRRFLSSSTAGKPQWSGVWTMGCDWLRVGGRQRRYGLISVVTVHITDKLMTELW